MLQEKVERYAKYFVEITLRMILFLLWHSEEKNCKYAYTVISSNVKEIASTTNAPLNWPVFVS